MTAERNLSAGAADVECHRRHPIRELDTGTLHAMFSVLTDRHAPVAGLNSRQAAERWIADTVEPDEAWNIFYFWPGEAWGERIGGGLGPGAH